MCRAVMQLWKLRQDLAQQDPGCASGKDWLKALGQATLCYIQSALEDKHLGWVVPLSPSWLSLHKATQISDRKTPI